MDIPITNILNWRKPKSSFSEGHSRYIYYPRENDFEETLYFNHCIYHYFCREMDGNKEGIDIQYDNWDVGYEAEHISKDFQKQTKCIIVEDE